MGIYKYKDSLIKVGKVKKYYDFASVDCKYRMEIKQDGKLSDDLYKNSIFASMFYDVYYNEEIQEGVIQLLNCRVDAKKVFHLENGYINIKNQTIDFDNGFQFIIDFKLNDYEKTQVLFSNFDISQCSGMILTFNKYGYKNQFLLQVGTDQNKRQIFFWDSQRIRSEIIVKYHNSKLLVYYNGSCKINTLISNIKNSNHNITIGAFNQSYSYSFQNQNNYNNIVQKLYSSFCHCMTGKINKVIINN